MPPARWRGQDLGTQLPGATGALRDRERFYSASWSRCGVLSVAVGSASRAVSPSGLRGPVVGVQALRGAVLRDDWPCYGSRAGAEPRIPKPQRPLGDGEGPLC